MRIKLFDLGKSKTYTPDFYLVDSDSYIEVKGDGLYWVDSSILSLNANIQG